MSLPLRNCPFARGIWTSSNNASFGRPESIIQTASRWVQPFCTAHVRVSSGMSGRALPPQNYPFQWAHPTHDSLSPPEPTTQTASRSFSLCTAHGRVSSGINCPFICMGIWTHLIHSSVGPPESTAQTASRSVQPFWAAHFIVSSGMSVHALAPQNYPLSIGNLYPIQYMLPWPT